MRLLGIASVLSLILASAPAGAAAQSHAAPSDPEADSPSGAVYELPLDRARKDAAPRRGQNGSSGKQSGGSGQDSSGDPARSDTSIRSENNFGSSSQVPGVSGGADDDGGGAAGAGGSGGAGSGGSGGDGGGSGGSSDSGDDLARSRAEELATRATGNPIASGGPSNGVVLPLVIALLAVGAAIGLVAARRSRTLRRRDI